MARVIFWDVDTQHDFMKADGKLYVPDSEHIIPNLKRLTDYAHGHGIRVIASADDHVMAHAEISEHPDWQSTFPPHCLRGTPGQDKIPETALRDPLVIEPEPQDDTALATRVKSHRGDILFHKHRFDVFSNPHVLPVLDVLNPHDIVLYGVALDVCDKYAIEGLLQHRPQVRLFAVVDAMKPIDRDVAEHLLKEWGEEGVRLVKTSEVVWAGWSKSSSGRAHDVHCIRSDTRGRRSHIRQVLPARTDGRSSRGSGGHDPADDRASLLGDGKAAAGRCSEARRCVPDGSAGIHRYELGDRLHGDGGAQRRPSPGAVARQRRLQRAVPGHSPRVRQRARRHASNPRRGAP